MPNIIYQNDSLVTYWLLTLLVLLILAITIGIVAASIITSLIIIVIFYIMKSSNLSSYTNENSIKNELLKLPELDSKIIENNKKSLDDIFSNNYQSADDMLAYSLLTNGDKEKKAKVIRSHLNNNNWKKYYDYEFNIHSGENRDWWSNDDQELSKRHNIDYFY